MTTELQLWCAGGESSGGPFLFFCLSDAHGVDVEEQFDDYFDGNEIPVRFKGTYPSNAAEYFSTDTIKPTTDEARDYLDEWEREQTAMACNLDLFTTTRPTLPGDAQRVTEAIERAGAVRTTAGGERA
jgi:hypothetical protein